MGDHCWDLPWAEEAKFGEPPMGEFNWALDQIGPELKPGDSQILGICEGHGSTVYLKRKDDGTLWFTHGRVFVPNLGSVCPRPRLVHRPKRWFDGLALLRGLWCQMRRHFIVIETFDIDQECWRCEDCGIHWWDRK
jgi:hypothetical protein